ncbi:MAG: hypothetical protein KAR39_07915 [Thermoplasmata archaeon]|nr:hypothetical protein [Thermoplasmata archaeon]
MTRRIGAIAILMIFVASGLVIPTGSEAEVFSGELVPGSKVVYLTECNNLVDNNFVNGSLTVKMVGQSFNGCDVIIIVQSNQVGGSLEVVVKDNTLIAGSMYVIVTDNMQVGGRMLVTVKNNVIHKRDPAFALDYNLKVVVNKNGGNGQDMSKNEVLAEGLKINVIANWVKNRLTVESKTNFAGMDYKLFARGNTVNNFDAIIVGNIACRDHSIRFVSNTVDTKFELNIEGNKATRNTRINVDENKVPYLSPMELEARIKDNHAAVGDITITMNENEQTNIIDGKFEKNGAGRNGKFTFRGNKAYKENQIEILTNRVENKREIQVTGNQPTPDPYVIKDNWACKYSIKPNLQSGHKSSGNDKKCTQKEPTHTDIDGLSDAYEQMIGTNPGNWDTDMDGLADGWADYDKSGTVNGNEAFGEIGDPQVPKGKTHLGAVDTLFNRPKEAPNCLCKDVYVEVDFMKKGKTIRAGGSKKSSGGSLSRQVTDGISPLGVPMGGTFSLVDKPHLLTAGQINPTIAFLMRRGIRLHVDTGWPLGVARADARGGGEWLRHKELLRFQFNTTEFDIYNFKNGEITKDWDGNGVREPRHFSSNRKGSFRYMIIGHNFSEASDRSGVAQGPGDIIFISHGNFLGGGISKSGIGQALAYTFCHELGHSLNLGLSSATHESAPSGFWSCLSYNESVVFSYIGYSDGVLESHDDWPDLNPQMGIAQWWTKDYSK